MRLLADDEFAGDFIDFCGIDCNSDDLLLEDFDWSDGMWSVSSGGTAVASKSTKRRKNPLSAEARERRNARRRQPFRILRVPKNDLRKTISSMIVNVANSWDVGFAREFHHRFCLPDCVLASYTSQMSHKPMFNVIQGFESMLKIFQVMMECIPDSALEMHSSEVRSLPDRTTIISRLTCRGTILFKPKPKALDVQFTRLVEEGNSVVKCEDGSIRTLGPQASELHAVIQARASTLDKWFDDLEPMESPMSFSAEACMIIRLDERAMIQSFDIVDAVASHDYYLPQQHLLQSQ